MSRFLLILALSLFAVLGLLPLAVMLARITPADLTALADERGIALLGRTLLLAGSTAGIALFLGLPFGFLVARTDLPGAAWLRPLGIVPLLMPPLLLAMTWSVLVELRGAPAAIAVLSLSTFPLVAMFSARAFERIDGRAEDAARLIGGLGTVLRMELPLVLPAALAGACLAFTFAVNDFGVPDYVSSVGPKFGVYADEIKLNWDQFHRPGKAVATALPLMSVALLALVPALALRRRGALASLGSGFRAPAPLSLGRWRWPAFLFVFGLLMLACFVPIGRLFWEAAAMPRHLDQHGFLSAFEPAFETMRKEFGTALELAKHDLANSVVFAFSTALLCVPIALVLGHAVERMRHRWAGRLLELGTLLPIAAPAILFGIGVIAVWNHDLTADLYDGGAMAVMLFAGRFLAFAVLVTSGAVASFDPVLEEAAALSGAGPVKRLFRIVAPNLMGSLVAAFVLVFVFTMRDLDSAILVPAANKTAMLRVFNGVHFGRDSYVAALSLLLVFAIVLPGLLWSLFARRRLEILP